MGDAFSASAHMLAAGHFCSGVFCGWRAQKKHKKLRGANDFFNHLESLHQARMLSTIAVDKVVQRL